MLKKGVSSVSPLLTQIYGRAESLELQAKSSLNITLELVKPESGSLYICVCVYMEEEGGGSEIHKM